MQIHDKNYNEALNKIQYYTKKYRNADKFISKEVDFTHPIHYEERVGYFNNKTAKRLIIRLRSSGCSWVKKTGGCTMCGFYLATGHGKKVTSSQYKKQFNHILEEVNLNDYKIIGIYNDGNFLNEGEITINTIKDFCKILNSYDNIKLVNFESRAEYLAIDRVKKIKNFLKDKELQISVGFESINPEVVQLCINKGLYTLNFGKIFRDLQKIGVRVNPLLLFKPPFLTEKESINDVLNTIDYLVSNGIHSADLEIATVMKYTLLHELWKRKLYHTAMLWSVRELILQYKKIHGNKFNLYISPWSYSVNTLDGPRNCGKCDKKIIDAINEYNKNYNPDSLKDINCSCIDIWKEKMKDTNKLSIPKRILNNLGKLENN